ncbi:uncharacterized protein LOC126318452 isoform X2 [Schistocerca gregaria]|uniref:uncharacterized protein LOC126318452 isoform X2 n=1 Tax=Schistocerca gregaria TaxID=7010 RepID=UPI00211E727E|nr:uncharacterized protein LOC126318452 isoform X2 [Schistocerca gregaria]
MDFFDSVKRFLGVNSIHQGKLTEGHFDVSICGHFGLLSGPTCMFYDGQNGLVFTASKNHFLKIYGRQGVEIMLRTNEEFGAIKGLFFVPRTTYLLVRYEKFIETWNLCLKEPHVSFSFDHSITCMSYAGSEPSLYVGLANGDVKVINTSNWTLSTYMVEFADAGLPEKLTKDAVAAILPNPDKKELLLIGYSCGVINEWNFFDRRVRRSYYVREGLTTLAWAERGERFLSGYQNGEIWSFKKKKNTADENFSFGSILEYRLSSVRNLEYCKYKGDHVLVYLVNTDGIDRVMVAGAKSPGTATFLRLADGPSQSRQVSVCDSKCVLNDQGELVAVLALLSNGQVKCAELSEGVEAPSLCTTVAMEDSMKVVLSKSFVVSETFLQYLATFSNLSPVNGAYIEQVCMFSKPDAPIAHSNATRRLPVVLISVYSNKMVYFWQVVSESQMFPIYKIEFPALKHERISVMNFCPHSLVLIFGTSRGRVLVYRFSVEPCDLAPFAYDEEESAGYADLFKEEKPNTEEDESSLSDSAKEEQPDTSDRLFSVQPAGFQVALSLELRSAIEYILFEVGLNALLVGAANGVLQIYCVTVAGVRRLWSEKFTSPVSSARFMRDRGRLSLLLGFRSGLIVCVDMEEQKPNAILTKKREIADIQILCERGSIIGIPKKLQENSIAESFQGSPSPVPYSRQTNTNKDPAQVNLDANEPRSWFAFDNDDDSSPTCSRTKFVVIHTFNDLTICRLTDQKLHPISQIQYRVPIKAIHNVSTEVRAGNSSTVEHGLLALDLNSDIYIWSLMDLSAITPEEGISLKKKYQVAGISSPKIELCSVLESGRMFYHTENHEVYVVELFRSDLNEEQLYMIKMKAIFNEIAYRQNSPEEDQPAKKMQSLFKNRRKKDVNLSTIFGATNIVADGGEVKSILAENMQKLADRKEKVLTLSNKTSELADNAGAFAALARGLSSAHSEY